MLSLLIIFLFTSVGTTFFGYWAHKSLHLKLMSYFSKSHKVHHDDLYPIDDFKSDKYRSAGKDSTVIFFVFASLPVLAIPLLLSFFGILTLFQSLFSVAIMLIIGWLHDYIHEVFHLNYHWLQKAPLVSKYLLNLEKFHFIHHKNEKKNYGILTYFWDKIFETYES
jgi:sterol desaturase/sphingolipid hydroxylase (fatty acid hydroxylase superfamily)